MERHFDEELKELKGRLLYMGGLAEEMIANSIKALTERKIEITESVYRKEDEVNLLQVEIDGMALKMMALHQPAAVDLRFLLGVIKINSELERMGDMALNICQNTKAIIDREPLKPLIDIPKMAETVREMVKDSLDAFVRQDARLAKAVCERDDEVDSLKDRVFRELLAFMISKPSTIERAMDLILISRHLERIADHSTNIGEEVIFMVQGKDIRHHVSEQGPEDESIKKKPKVLFICTRNTARSQMAEAFLKKYAGEKFDVCSAGLEPDEKMHPFVKKVMDEIGISTEGQYPKNVIRFLGKSNFSYIITLCSDADKKCPIFPGVSIRLHWPFGDPAAFEGADEEKLEKFRKVRDKIDEQIKLWLKNAAK